MMKTILIPLLLISISAHAATFKSVQYVPTAHAWFYVYSATSGPSHKPTDVSIGPILECHKSKAGGADKMVQAVGKIRCFITETEGRNEALNMANAWERNLPKTGLTTTDIENRKAAKLNAAAKATK